MVGLTLCSAIPCLLRLKKEFYNTLHSVSARHILGPVARANMDNVRLQKLSLIPPPTFPSPFNFRDFEPSLKYFVYPVGLCDGTKKLPNEHDYF